jgi:hypothetical protein
MSQYLFPLTFQAESVRDAAWGCDWVGTPVPFQRCLAFIIATVNKEFTLTAGKFVPVSNSTMMNVRDTHVLVHFQGHVTVEIHLYNITYNVSPSERI